jgi:hypothetical protein
MPLGGPGANFAPCCAAAGSVAALAWSRLTLLRGATRHAALRRRRALSAGLALADRVFDIVDLERETQAAVFCGQSKSVLDADCLAVS